MTTARIGARVLFAAAMVWATLAVSPVDAMIATDGPGSSGSGTPAGAGSAQPDRPEAGFALVAELDELTEDHATLFRLYWAFFLRDPDADGALYWIERQERCDSLSDIADLFAAGDEFANRYGVLDDEAFVEQIYRNVLERGGDAAGLEYWTDLVVDGRLSRGEMVLNVSLSAEFRGRHPYPSDGVPGRSCRLPSGDPTPRTHYFTNGQRFASLIGGARLDLIAPASVIERVGFHQSMHPGAQAMMAHQDSPMPITTLASRGRDTDRRGAADVVVHPLVPIQAPVSGRVLRAGNYVLYCKYRDGYVVIRPTDRPELEVKILHVQDVAVEAGDWIVVGDHLAARATPFPFRSQIDRLTAEPSWPHVHIEVVDPRIPRKPSNSSC